MANSPQFNAAIESAAREAIATVNTGSEIFYDTPENVEIVRRFMLREGLPQVQWTSAFVWQSAILETRKLGLLKECPTRASIEAARRAADAAPGRQKYLKPTGEAPKNFLEQIKENVLGTQAADARAATDRATAEANALVEQQTLLESISLGADYQNQPPEIQRMYKRLTPENMKRWNKLRAERAHRERFPDSFTGR